ncbi:hypothetical protein K488DRAFT_56673 [Vararia minispora EC-137]|uniref:Uncharacterized protein n=1 Tax=Vararia minispora EC-137 TaxID=1314806 RepID=A0ACB8QBY2_9AGAM|nr:hypothetical protein K488DRAFT_56673 [Vararia minispora EC-137]
MPANSTSQLSSSETRARLYPQQVWYCVASFIFVICLGHRVDIDHQRRKTGGILWRQLPVAGTSLWRRLAYRTAIRTGKDCTLNFMEVFVVAGYFVLVWTWCLINTTNVQTGEKFNIKYLGNRAATIVSSQLSLVVALGMRNNIIAALTGISFEKLNYLHRMFARILTPAIWLHAGCKVRPPFEIASLHNPDMACGLLAIASFTALWAFSWGPLRRRAYELFYLFHFLTVFLLLIGAYLHARSFELGYYILPALGLWALDRLLRVIRIFIFNHGYFGLTSGTDTFDATAELITSDVVRLRFRRPSHLHWEPGQNAWLTMPGVSALPFESHPFTIATVDSPLESGTSTEKDELQPTPAKGKELTFIIQTRRGFTRRLQQIASTSGTLKVLFDGPYSLPPRLAYYDTVVLFAGGTGISFTCPLFVDLVHKARRDPSYCRSAIFVWAIRDPELIGAVYDDLIQALKDSPSTLCLSVRIHVTRIHGVTLPVSDAEDRASSTGTENGSVKDLIARAPHTETISGRPSVQAILEEAILSAHGPVAVAGKSVVCGPDSMSRETKRVLRSSLAGPMKILEGGSTVDLFVETFGAVSVHSRQCACTV